MGEPKMNYEIDDITNLCALKYTINTSIHNSLGHIEKLVIDDEKKKKQ